MMLFPFKTFSLSVTRRKNSYDSTADCCQSTKREFYWKRYYTAHCALHNHFKSSSGHLPAFILKKVEIISKARIVSMAELKAQLHTLGWVHRAQMQGVERLNYRSGV